jgi:hypothetical protein
MTTPQAWYILLPRGAGSEGPFDADSIVKMIWARQLDRGARICAVGSSDWAPITSDLAFAQAIFNATPENPFPRGYQGRTSLSATAPMASSSAGSAGSAVPAAATAPPADSVPDFAPPRPFSDTAPMGPSPALQATLPSVRRGAGRGRARRWALGAAIGASVAVVGVVAYSLASRASQTPDAAKGAVRTTSTQPKQDSTSASTGAARARQGAVAQQGKCGCADDDLECTLRCAKRR